jgi:hypothetical protein
MDGNLFRTGRTLLVPALVLAALAPAITGQSPDPAHGPVPKATPPPEAPSTPARAIDPEEKRDERARAAFAALEPAQKKELCDFLELETSHLGTFQSDLIAWVLKQQDRDPLRWPLVTPPPTFDPLVHAPAQPIARKLLDPGSASAKAAVERILGERESARARLRPGYVYDYSTGELRRIASADEPQRIFENALRGHPPKLDLAEALVERMLDDGSQKQRAIAFAHAYSDRSGNVFPGITLYDAYGSGTDIEMPDVETLGIAHTLFDDWTTWKAPIPGPQQEPLYEKIGAEFLALHRHRGLRHALTMTFARGTVALQDGYDGFLDNLHALWEDCKSTPDTLGDRLPSAADWSKFLEAWRQRCIDEGELYAAGQNRRAVLDASERAVRETVFRVLGEYGALAPQKPPAAGEKQDH